MLFSPFRPRPSSALLTVTAGLLAGLAVLAAAPARAQTPRQAPAQEHRSPSPTGNPAGTGVPDYAEPAPPSPQGSRSGGARSPGTSAQTNDPGTPTEPTQTPLGGAEWLAAAGAAYAIRRLRRSQGEQDEDEGSEDGMP